MNFVLPGSSRTVTYTEHLRVFSRLTEKPFLCVKVPDLLFFSGRKSSQIYIYGSAGASHAETSRRCQYVWVRVSSSSSYALRDHV